jgi:hypothetical protein
MKAESGADYVKIKVRTQMDGSSKSIINQYYRNIPTVNVEFLSQVEAKKQKMEESIHDSYNYLVDPGISDLERFVMYVNEKEGEQFITTEELKRLLKSDI